MPVMGALLHYTALEWGRGSKVCRQFREQSMDDGTVGEGELIYSDADGAGAAAAAAAATKQQTAGAPRTIDINVRRSGASARTT